MSSELLNRNKTNVDADLLAAKEEARRALSDDELDMVAGGVGKVIFCPFCGQSGVESVGVGFYECLSCHEKFGITGKGDKRGDMNEVFADIAGLMLDIDGWD